MPTQRQRRVADQIREILAELIQFEVGDPRLAGVTVMDVTIDRELMVATIYVNALGGEEAQQDVMTGLSKAAGFLRRELGRRVRLQHTPELRFKWDETLEAAAKIDALIRALHEAEASKGSEAVDEID